MVKYQNRCLKLFIKVHLPLQIDKKYVSSYKMKQNI